LAAAGCFAVVVVKLDWHVLLAQLLPLLLRLLSLLLCPGLVLADKMQGFYGQVANGIKAAQGYFEIMRRALLVALLLLQWLLRLVQGHTWYIVYFIIIKASPHTSTSMCDARKDFFKGPMYKHYTTRR